MKPEELYARKRSTDILVTLAILNVHEMDTRYVNDDEVVVDSTRRLTTLAIVAKLYTKTEILEGNLLIKCSGPFLISKECY